MRKETTESLTPIILFDYMLLVGEYFADATTTEDFIIAHRQNFPHYENVRKNKLDPKSIKESGSSSCTSAALLFGLWHLLRFDYSSPRYYIETVSQDGGFNPVPVKSVHCKIALPSPSKVEYFHLKETQNHDTKKMDFRITPSQYIEPEKYPTVITQTSTFAARGISLLGLNKARIAELLNPQTELRRHALSYVNRPTEFFTFLKWCYANRAQT